VPEDDQDLLDAWSAGDLAAGNELVGRHAHTVLRFFRRKVDQEAEDLVQQTFLECTACRHRILSSSSFRAFLLGVARNVLLRHRRQLAQRIRRDEIRAAPDSVTTPSRHAQLHQEQRILLAALRQLPLDLQIAIELHYWEQLKVREIAEILEAPSGTIKWRLARARTLLKENIAGCDAPEETRRRTITNLRAWARSLRDTESGGISPASEASPK